MRKSHRAKKRGEAYRLRGQKRYREALAAYCELIDDLGEGTARDYNHRGLCHSSLGNREAAIRDYSESISLGGISNLHFTYYNRGFSHYKLKQYEEAISDCTEAIRLRDDYASAYYHRAMCHRELNHPEEALSDINEAIRLQPEKGSYVYERGIIKMNCIQDYESALSDFNEAIRLGYVRSFCYRERGICYQRMGQFNKALLDFSGSIRLDSCSAICYDSRGIILNEMKRYQEAIVDFQQALRWTFSRYDQAPIERRLDEAKQSLMELLQESEREELIARIVRFTSPNVVKLRQQESTIQLLQSERDESNQRIASLEQELESWRQRFDPTRFPISTPTETVDEINSKLEQISQRRQELQDVSKEASSRMFALLVHRTEIRESHGEGIGEDEDDLEESREATELSDLTEL